MAKPRNRARGRGAALVAIFLPVLLGVAAVPVGATTHESAASAKESKCKREDDESVGKWILRCSGPSVAFVETPFATGSGVVIAHGKKKYLLTNLHVVDPFRNAKVRVGAKTYEEVPVFALDVATDLAILGPIPGKKLPRALSVSDGKGLEKGDDLYLVGYPDETQGDDEDLEATITRGVYSRERRSKEFKQAFVQTDAAIVGGQSGGGLFDGRNRLVGISGLGFAEEFALVLSGRDVKRTVEAMFDKPRIPKGLFALPTSAEDTSVRGAKSGTVEVDSGVYPRQLELPASERARSLSFTVDMAANPAVTIEATPDPDDFDAQPELLAISANAEEVSRQLSEAMFAVLRDQLQLGEVSLEDVLGELGFDPLGDALVEQFGEVPPEARTREPAPGVFRVPIPKDTAVTISINAFTLFGPVPVAWTSSLALSAYPGLPEVKTLEVGETDDVLLDGFVEGFDFLVPLTQGQEVEVYARSPQGDVSVTVYPDDRPVSGFAELLGLLGDELGALDGSVTQPGTDATEPVVIDDGGGGIYDVDAKGTYTAATTGVHRMRVSSYDGTPVLVRFSVRDCAKTACEEE